ncbi:hypothetical protein LCGC14_1481230 [marine sediment metagenome]|uniref:Uncharacterized protein n=1 Tax=marine sediment metagenome TaxID=412755 RepID=A0A0F9J9G9_9ZZZZ
MKRKIESWEDLTIPYSPRKYPEINKKIPNYCGYCDTMLEFADRVIYFGDPKWYDVCRFCFSKLQS